MAGTNSTPEGIYDLWQEVDMHLAKAEGIVFLFSVGKVDEEVEAAIHNAAWSAHGHIEDAKKILRTLWERVNELKADLKAKGGASDHG